MFSIGFYLIHGAFHRFSRIFFFLSFFTFVWIRYVHVAIALRIKPYHHQRRLYDSSHAPNIYRRKKNLFGSQLVRWHSTEFVCFFQFLQLQLIAVSAAQTLQEISIFIIKQPQSFRRDFIRFFFSLFSTVLNLVFIAFVFESSAWHYSGITGTRTRGRWRKISLFNFDEMDREWRRVSTFY